LVVTAILWSSFGYCFITHDHLSITRIRRRVTRWPAGPYRMTVLLSRRLKPPVRREDAWKFVIRARLILRTDRTDSFHPCVYSYCRSYETVLGLTFALVFNTSLSKLREFLLNVVTNVIAPYITIPHVSPPHINYRLQYSPEDLLVVIYMGREEALRGSGMCFFKRHGKGTEQCRFLHQN